jgi:hypothetical protein
MRRPVVNGDDASVGFIERSVRRCLHHRLKPFYDARLDEDECLIGCDRHIEHGSEHAAFQVGQPTRSVSLFRLQAITRRATALRVAFDQRDKAVIG